MHNCITSLGLKISFLLDRLSPLSLIRKSGNLPESFHYSSRKAT